MIANEVTDLPEPDSPTIPNDSPLFREKDKFFTASTVARSV